jgi:hypothetical protein
MTIDWTERTVILEVAWRQRAVAWLLVAVAGIAGIAGCSGVSVGVNAPPDPPGFAFASTAVSATTSDSAGAAQNGVLQFGLTVAATNAGTVPQLSPTWSGSAIRSVGVTLVPVAAAVAGGNPTYQGVLTVTFWPGATLGAGQYNGTVKLTACAAQGATACSAPLSASITATLSVTGATRPTTTLTSSPSQLDIESPVTSSAPVVAPLQIALSQPSPPIYVTLGQPSATWVSGLSYQSVGSQAGVVSLTLLPAAQLVVGIHPGSATLNACLDAQCTHPLQNSPITLPITYRAIPLAQLNRWFQGGFAGKKIVVWGNSTVSNAVYFFQQFDTYTQPGGPLAGLSPTNVLNYGNNGASLAALLAGEGPFPIAAVIAAQPDLLIMRGPLINDVRLGYTDLAQAEQLLTEALNQITAGSPNTDILLTVENSFLTTNVDDYNFVQPNADAQQYTNILHEAELSMKGLYPHVAVYDIMALEYGTICQPSSPLMANQIHPGQAGQVEEAGLDVQVVGLPLLAN